MERKSHPIATVMKVTNKKGNKYNVRILVFADHREMIPGLLDLIAKYFQPWTPKFSITMDFTGPYDRDYEIHSSVPPSHYFIEFIHDCPGGDTIGKVQDFLKQCNFG